VSELIKRIKWLGYDAVCIASPLCLDKDNLKKYQPYRLAIQF